MVPNANRMAVLIIVIAIAIFMSLSTLALVGFIKLNYSQLVPSPSAITKGKVISYKCVSVGTGRQRHNKCECTVSFQVEGKNFYKDRASCLFAGVGNEVNVGYQTTNPDNADVDNSSLWNFVGFIGVLFGLTAYLSFRKLRKLMKETESVESNETSLSIQK